MTRFARGPRGRTMIHPLTLAPGGHETAPHSAGTTTTEATAALAGGHGEIVLTLTEPAGARMRAPMGTRFQQ